MKKFSVFSKVLVIIVIIIGTVAIALCVDNIINNKKVTIKVTATPTVTETPIDLNQCGVSYVKVLLAVIDADEMYPPSFDGSKEHEIWKIYVFGGKTSVDESKLTDRWGNKVDDIVFNAKIDDVSQKITGLEEAWYFNQFGYLGGWDDGEGQFKLEGFCQKIDGNITWAKQDEYIPLGTYSFSYPTDSITSWSDYDFTIKVFSGHVLSDEDLKILDFQTRALHENTRWSRTGYVGPSSSNLGMFDIDENSNELIWNFVWSNPDYNITENTKIFIPIGTEVVVETLRPGWKVESQRFVLVEMDHQMTMVELSTSD